jgi:hypothetical protein
MRSKFQALFIIEGNGWDCTERAMKNWSGQRLFDLCVMLLRRY